MSIVRRSALAASFVALASVLPAQQPAANKANWTLSNMFADTATIRRVSYTTSLTPNWINNGDSLWYNWRDRNSCSFYVAYPRTKAKTLSSSMLMGISAGYRQPCLNAASLAAWRGRESPQPFPNRKSFCSLNSQ